MTARVPPPDASDLRRALESVGWPALTIEGRRITGARDWETFLTTASDDARLDAWEGLEAVEAPPSSAPGESADSDVDGDLSITCFDLETRRAVRRAWRQIPAEIRQALAPNMWYIVLPQHAAAQSVNVSWEAERLKQLGKPPDPSPAPSVPEPDLWIAFIGNNYAPNSDAFAKTIRHEAAHCWLKHERSTAATEREAELLAGQWLRSAERDRLVAAGEAG